MEQQVKDELILNEVRGMVQNAMLLRSQLLNKLTDPRRDLNAECGYPETISPQQYRDLFDRSGIAKRVVSLMPSESWSEHPEVYETEDDKETPFEKAWKDLGKSRNVFYHLRRLDTLAGIGRFGVLLVGLDDGLDLDKPADGVDDKLDGLPVKQAKERKVTFLRAFDESVVLVPQRETNIKSPRFGKPILYSIQFREEGSLGGYVPKTSGDSQPGGAIHKTLTVHWSRVIHLAEDCVDSEVYGTPRLQAVFNSIYDYKKVLGGSGEMFWRGAFPGLSFETAPGTVGEVEIDAVAVKEQVQAYMNGLQRYLALTGMTAKSLTPQIADPRFHVEKILQDIALSIGCPTRVFLGTEEAKLASGQDAKAWNKRVRERQIDFLTPMVLLQLVYRLIAMGVLPLPKDVLVDWKDLNTLTDGEKADVALKRTQALAAYVSGGVDAVIPPAEYMTIVLEMDPKEVEKIEGASEEYDELDEEGQLRQGEIDAEKAKVLAEAAPPEPKAPPVG